ncbi:MAG: helix-turn-helix transcriptional regulator, partial [Actinobacteria bacterium]|nr:helix-turn-helix transcriptional regulator [Actinomycetota bacterium]
VGDLPELIRNLVVAERLLNGLDSEAPQIQVERARLALFSGDDVQALLLAQSVGDASTTKRTRLARCLVSAVAAWNCGKRQEALLAMSHVAPLLLEGYRPSSLWNVPYGALHEVAIAARDEGICDVVEMIDAVPEQARAARYGRLTDMEQRTLQAIAEHRSANDAAQALFVTPGTVKKHLASVYRKLAVNGRDEAILRAARMGIISVGSAQRG